NRVALEVEAKQPPPVVVGNPERPCADCDVVWVLPDVEARRGLRSDGYADHDSGVGRDNPKRPSSEHDPSRISPDRDVGDDVVRLRVDQGKRVPADLSRLGSRRMTAAASARERADRETDEAEVQEPAAHEARVSVSAA